MIMPFFFPIIVALSISHAAIVHADATQSQSKLVLQGPEVYKSDWNTRGLTTADLNGDGLADLALINNERGRIDLLYQRGSNAKNLPETTTNKRYWRPVLEDGRFQKQTVITGRQMFALAIGDLNNDGKPDIAFTCKPDGLIVLFQGADNTFAQQKIIELKEPNQWSSSLFIRDMDGKDKQELVMLGKKQLSVITFSTKGQLFTNKHYQLADSGSYNPLAVDINDDKRLDILYLASKSRYGVRFRLQDENGDFGPEHAFRIRTPKTLLNYFQPRDQKTPLFTTIQQKTGVIDTWTIIPPTHSNKDQAFTPEPQVYPTPTKRNTASSYALGDFDGDGLTDIALADTKGAQIWVFPRITKDRFGEPLPYPAFADIKGLSAGDSDGDGRDELFIVSASEKVIGTTRMTKKRRLVYPTPVSVPGTPLALTTLPRHNESSLVLACISKDQKRKRTLFFLANDKTKGSWQVLQKIALTGLKTDPHAMESIDINQDQRMDLIVYVVHGPSWIFLQDEHGKFSRLSVTDGFRQGLLTNQHPGNISTGDIDDDKTAEILATGKGFVRAMRFVQGQGLQVHDQINTLNEDAKVVSAIAIDIGHDGDTELLLKEKASDTLLLLERNSNGLYRHNRSLPVGTIALVDSHLLKDKNDQSEILLYLGKDRFWAIPVAHTGLSRQPVVKYETDLEDFAYERLALGDIDGDGTVELIALDTAKKHILEILRWQTNNWHSILHFAVFADTNDNEDNDKDNEPRSLIVTDITGNGADDIVLLVHDRILIYTNSKPQ